MEGRPSIRVKLLFEPNTFGTDPVGDIRGVKAFPGRGWKGVVNAGEIWECDIVYASFNYAMIAPRQEVATAPPEELGVLRLYAGSRPTRILTLDEAADLMRTGQVPPPTFTPQRLPPRRPLPTATAVTQASLPPASSTAVAAGATAKPPSAPASVETVPAAIARPPTPPAVKADAASAVALPASATDAQTPTVEPAGPARAPGLPSPSEPAQAPAAPRSIPVSAGAPSGPLAPPRDDDLLVALRRALEGPQGRQFLEELRGRAGTPASLGRIEDALDGQESLLRGMQGDAGELRRRMKDLTAQVEEVRQQAREWKRSLTQDLRGVPKPVPRDPEHPTEDEIEREVVHQLYQKNCWGAKYGQYEKLKRGYNSRASDRDVRAAVRRLEDKRWIALYPKDTDQFRLNPAKAEEIYEFLGVPRRQAEQLAEDTRDEAVEAETLSRRDLEEALDGVLTRLELDRVLAPLRQRLASLETTTAPPSPPAGAAHSARELEALRNMVQGLQGDLNRVRKASEDAVAAQRRLVERIQALEAKATA